MTNNKNYEIEALRGLAIILVIVGHFGNLTYWLPGLTDFLDNFAFGGGVDLFFVISGFVITKSFYRDLSQATNNIPQFFIMIKSFMLRRFFRVMPAALIWILIVCSFSIWYNQTGIFGNLTGNFSDLISIIFNYSNFHFVNCIKDNFPAARCGYNAIYWSMSLEEQFYLFFPLLVFLRKKWIIVITLGAFIFFGSHARSLLEWFTHPEGLLAGMCLAFATESSSYHSLEQRLPANLLFRMGAVSALIAAILFMPHLRGALHIIYPELITLCCFLLVGLASFRQERAFETGPWRSVLAYIGGRSFSLYLVHNPVAWFMRESSARLGLLDTKGWPQHPVLFVLTALALIALLAEASYWLVETPWRHWGRQISALPPETTASGELHVPAMFRKSPSGTPGV